MWSAANRSAATWGQVLGGFVFYFAYLIVGSTWASSSVQDLQRIQNRRIDDLEQVWRSSPLEPSLSRPIEPLLLPQHPVTHRLDDRPSA
jgi:hypothetical protein